MWGDPERAVRLDQTDSLAGILFQVTGPAHIPWQDPRWQELLHGYNVWVHVELQRYNYDVMEQQQQQQQRQHEQQHYAEQEQHRSLIPPEERRRTQQPYPQSTKTVMEQACQSLTQHAPRSSNLAAFSMHVTRMLRELLPTTLAVPATSGNSGGNSNATEEEDPVAAFSQRIAMVGRARATAGALNLFRILVHAMILEAAHKQSEYEYYEQQQQQTATVPSNDSSTPSSTSWHARFGHTQGPSSLAATSTIQTGYNYLQEAFLYKSRDSIRGGGERDTAGDLLDALLSFLSNENSPLHNNQNALQSVIPEVYDATVLSLQLLLVLLSSQLYQPFLSSFQIMQSASDSSSSSSGRLFFWERLMKKAKARRQREIDRQHGEEQSLASTGSSQPLQQQRNKKDTKAYWTPRTVLRTCLEWHICRPAAPEKSIAAYNRHLACQVVQAKGTERVGADGMYESHLVVDACAPRPRHTTVVGEESTGGNNTDSVALATRPTSTALQRSYSSKMLLDATKGVLVLSSTIILLPFRLMSLALGLWGFHKEKGYDAAHKRQLQLQFQQASSSRTKDVLWLSDSPVADLAVSLFLLFANNNRANQQQQGESLAPGDDSNGGSDDADDSNNRNNKVKQIIDNPFRAELAALVDNRWEADGGGLPDLPDPLSMTSVTHNQDPFLSLNMSHDDEEGAPLMSLSASATPSSSRSIATVTSDQDVLTANFEALFASIGLTCHTEPGALVLYTLLQASPSFSDSIAVRSDLDTLVLPLLRTLYFASSLRHYAAQDYNSRAAKRRPSSGSLGSTATCGSSTCQVLSIRSCPFRSQSQLYVIIILLLLLSQDSSFGTDAFRRVMVPSVPWYKERHLKDISMGSVLILSLLRALAFNLNRLNDAFLLSNCCAVLMNLLPSVVDLHDYAAMRLAAVTISAMKRYTQLRNEHPDVDEEQDPSSPIAMHGEVSRTLLRFLKHCLSVKSIERNSHLVYSLVYHQADLKRTIAMKGANFKKSETSRILKVVDTANNIIANAGDARTAAKALKVLAENMERIKDVVADDKKKRSDAEDFSFQYEEEADPEIFFIPYVWEVIVCVVTSSSIEWNKNAIQVFALLEEEPLEDFQPEDELPTAAIHEFSKDVTDVV